MNQPKVSLITLNYNGLKDTIECLESLKKINYPDYEVIVVDNGSTVRECSSASLKGLETGYLILGRVIKRSKVEKA